MVRTTTRSLLDPDVQVDSTSDPDPDRQTRDPQDDISCDRRHIDTSLHILTAEATSKPDTATVHVAKHATALKESTTPGEFQAARLGVLV